MTDAEPAFRTAPTPNHTKNADPLSSQSDAQADYLHPASLRLHSSTLLWLNSDVIDASDYKQTAQCGRSTRSRRFHQDSADLP